MTFGRVFFLSATSSRQLGLDVSSDVGGVGLYGETLVRVGTAEAGTQTTGRATVGVDYRFSFGVRTVAELHYSSLGESDAADYHKVTGTVEFQAGELFYLSKLYAGLMLQYDRHPTLTPTVVWLQNLLDGSAFAVASVAWDFGQNTAVNFGAMLPIGQGCTPSADAIGLCLVGTPQSEFGGGAYTFYTDLRLAF
jgi:hypothetical protein